MFVRVDLENHFEGKSIAWVQGHPGCFAYGQDGSEAIVRVPPVLIAYQAWVEKHTTDSWLANLGDFDVRLAEVMDRDNPAQAATNWFESDQIPLSKTDVERGKKLITWSRDDLLEIINPLSTANLDQRFEGERWNIRGILGHVATAELWYLERFGLADLKREVLARDIFERLAQVRTRVEKALVEMINREEIREMAGEKWSGRKFLRRLAWHERDHIQHILRLITLL